MKIAQSTYGNVALLRSADNWVASAIAAVAVVLATCGIRSPVGAFSKAIKRTNCPDRHRRTINPWIPN